MSVGLTFICVGLQGKGEGQLELKITYFPFELLYSKPRDASLVRARALHSTHFRWPSRHSSHPPVPLQTLETAKLLSRIVCMSAFGILDVPKCCTSLLAGH